MAEQIGWFEEQVKLRQRSTTNYTNEWATPQWLYDELDAEFHFTLDPCSNDRNHKCDKYFTEGGLEQSWKGERVFCNPPFSEIGKWVAKAFYETKADGTLVVMLIPTRTDTKYFHDYILNRAEVRFVRGRLKFGDRGSHAPFPSMIVIFRGAKV